MSASIDHRGLLQIEDCLDVEGNVVLPPGVTLVSLIDRNIANLGDTVAYRYLDYTGSADGRAIEWTWVQLGQRIRAIGAALQRVASLGDRVAILAPQGLDYVAGFYGAVKAGMIAVPLFAPELQGHAERLDTALRDARPAVILTTRAVAHAVEAFLVRHTYQPSPQLIVVDEIPDSVSQAFTPVDLNVDDVSHLQYTSGSTRPPVGVEITHRAVGTNLIQMILSIDLLDRNTHGVSWLPLYHDMGLSMIGFPAVYGGHSTLLAPTAFLRRPERWIRALSDESRRGRVVTAAPNFAYEYAAQRGLPAAGENIELRNVVMIVGSEPVNMDAITTFAAAFAPYGLPETAIKPSYGIAEATLFVSTIAPDAVPTVVHLDRAQLAEGRAVPVAPDAKTALPQVSCGQVARSQWAVIVDPDAHVELADGRVGEIWLHGDNVARRYWARPEESRQTFNAKLRSRLAAGSHAQGAAADAAWMRTGDLGMYLDGELYVTGRRADVVVVDGRQHYPHDIEDTVAEASAMVRRGYVAAFGIDDDDVVIIAERASGTRRADPAPAIAAIRTAVADVHGLSVADIRFVPAGSIPRTTSGKLARRACREQYLRGEVRE
ncbi:AMP-binding protein [Mycolicibacterium pulveris]|uniref:Nitrate ABC transporter substrate-binding protein n=1 Tax=Mycolicibacterium pulveris TaxID=36813 RepID=A0A7I7UP27_MYCPV|nr:fatty acyl-AMP ligase [Mycolicibacterium pulveris]MCV6982762.1 AMP-binding protein [Mycolicibacterium pulveris]BBY82623.1 nitrate ABC transporter substrate-binding protein [Mycolicibacterium pulveris]